MRKGVRLREEAVLETVLIDDYVPPLGASFPLLGFASIGGSGFARIDIDRASLPPPLHWDTSALLVTGELVVASAAEARAVPLRRGRAGCSEGSCWLQERAGGADGQRTRRRVASKPSPALFKVAKRQAGWHHMPSSCYRA